MVRTRSGSGGRFSKLPVFQARIFPNAGSAVASGASASITSPFWIQIFPSRIPLVIFKTVELCDKHSNWMMSTRLLLCTPRKPPEASRLSNDSIDSMNSPTSWSDSGLIQY